MTRRHYTWAETRYLVRGLIADWILGLALWVIPSQDKDILAKALVPYWKEAIKRTESVGSPRP